MSAATKEIMNLIARLSSGNSIILVSHLPLDNTVTLIVATAERQEPLREASEATEK